MNRLADRGICERAVAAVDERIKKNNSCKNIKHYSFIQNNPPNPEYQSDY